ncbi:MAG: universal stress protein [Rhodospirillaceae bacterium]|jgi:nucleotide-binding universal stress UspA family protein|nr:universal stress protein [Rhodospirillaceae bacterium]MBT4934180.1 universal stress protein [Rhodospirillaceae bacterium]MBT5244292.1 universal stress protein [Rhodospirillaceae bacterium]MBT5563653.1 universal stress protein [Rhodospirillaceae bacterium]MBT6241483.1 universal stress protein [Rhodospirillaceae bacterium]
MLKNILIHLDASKQNDSRLQTAIALGKRHGAHLTGLYVVTHPEIPTYIEAQIGGDVINAQIEAATQEGREVLERFEKQTAAEGLETESRLVEGTVVDCLTTHGRYFDLLVVGQYDPDDSGLHSVEDMPDRLIMSAGRPVLVVPYAGTFPDIGDRVIVSWDASRQATRSVNDAMAILEASQKVDVLSINPAGNDHGDNAGADIALQLARHGVNAEAKQITSPDVDAADMLLSRAADSSADMIVMGAYGHARWREIALGGFTRHMLAHMTVPVLMSN